MTDRYNARGMIIRQTLQAYTEWKPNIELEKLRSLLWSRDDYYRELDRRIASVWKQVAAGSHHEAVWQ